MLEFLNDYLVIISALTSGVLSFLVAKLTAKNEIKKIKIAFEQETKSLISEKYSELQGKINRCCIYPTPPYQREALAALGEFKAYATEEMLPICSALEQAITSSHTSTISEFANRLNQLWLKDKNHL